CRAFRAPLQRGHGTRRSFSGAPLPPARLLRPDRPGRRPGPAPTEPPASRGTAPLVDAGPLFPPDRGPRERSGGRGGAAAGPGPEPEEEVVGFRGRPLLIKTSRAWSRFRADELVARAPQYALELGLRCATTGTESGVVVVGFERAEVDRDRVQVLELRFASLTPFSRFYRERSRDLAVAIRDRAPAGLLACPDWMTSDCPYRSECGCGGPDSRVTR